MRWMRWMRRVDVWHDPDSPDNPGTWTVMLDSQYRKWNCQVPAVLQ
jgi:hypothetical protein